MMKMPFNVKALAEKHQEEFGVFEKTTRDVDLLVLKGHLLVEVFLTSLIEHYCWRPQFLKDAGLSFFNKAKLARCFVIHPMTDDEIWNNVELLNRLRNEIAHTWKGNKREGLIRKFLDYRARQHNKSGPRSINLSTNEKCAEEVALSISWLIGQLSVLDIVTAYMESQKTYGQQKSQEGP